MYKIAIVAYETTASVCSSIMMHVKMMADCGNQITMVVSKKVNQIFFGECNYKVLTYSSGKELKSILSSNSFDKIWCTNSIYVLYLSLIGVKQPIYLWMQGDTPAESYMHHHNKLRRFLLKRIVAYSFRKVKGIIYVSDAMKEYYESHYTVTPLNNIVVPCLSEFDGSLYNIERIPNSFVYIGGLSIWQCFDEILTIYKYLKTENSIFHIITRDIEDAKEKVRNIIGDTNKIEIYSISDRTQIPKTLSQFQYGFLIRQDDVVNLVSSPIKFLEYISCGVNVIMTDAVPSYARIVKQHKIGTIITLGEPIILNSFNDNVQDIYKELFNPQIYIKRYYSMLNQ